MPNDKDTALALQRKYFGDPQGLARHLVSICLNSVGVVREVFLILDSFSTIDVGGRFLNLLPRATLLDMVKTKKGKAFGEVLLGWLLNATPPSNTTGSAAPGIDLVIEFKRLRDALDNSSPQDDEENPYYTIDAGINLESEAIAVLDKIAPLYFAKVGEKFNVNSGTRDSWHQAEAMYVVYVTKDKNLSLYKNRKAANELIEIIKKGQRAGQSKDVIVQTMADLVEKYFKDGTLLSDHQKAGAIDIDINGDVGIKAMTSTQKKIMMEIATKITGYKALLESSPPHIHIKFKE